MKKFLSLIVVLSLGFTLTGCKKAPEGDAQTVINMAWEKMAEKNAGYQSGEITFSGKGNIEAENNRADISGSGNVQFDGTDKKNVKSAIALDLSANGEIEGQKGKIDLKAQVRMLEKTLYLFMENVNIDTGDPQTNVMANLIGNLYKSQWISLPGGDLETTDVAIENFTGAEIAEVAKKHHFFEVKEDLGNGRYEVVINQEKLKAYLKEVSELNESPMTEEDLEAIDMLFSTISYSLKVEIDNDYDLTWVKGDIKATDPTENQQMMASFEGTMDDNTSTGYIDLALSGTTPGKARVEFDIEHEEKTVTNEKPENAQDLDPAALL
ncbi:MAG: hypothetical protein AB7J40_01535, partial [Candidatus Altimarinota bacterium]